MKNYKLTQRQSERLLSLHKLNSQFLPTLLLTGGDAPLYMLDVILDFVDTFDMEFEEYLDGKSKV